LFGSGEITTGGYTLDVGGAPCARLPIIITDANAICGRRLVLGANDAALASQLVMALLVAGENVSTAVEAPRFHILADGSMGIEGAHSPAFDEDVLKYLETLTASPFWRRSPTRAATWWRRSRTISIRTRTAEVEGLQAGSSRSIILFIS
jgi:gamma-glutamyltranspeptidase